MNNKSKTRIISGRLSAAIPKMDDSMKRKMPSLMSLLLVSIFVTILFVSTASAEPYTVEKTILDISGNVSEVNITKAGDVINYQIIVTNDGETTPESVTVIDDLDPTVASSDPLESLTNDSVLEPAETWTYFASYTVTQNDMNINGTGSGVINNTASVTIDALDPINDSVEAPIIQNPSYTIDKTVTDVAGNGPEANATTSGDIISYQINVSNTGNIDLANAIVSDPLTSLEAPVGDEEDVGTLNVGESWIYSASYSVTQDDLNTKGGEDGFINNTASVDCDLLDPVNDSAEVPLEWNPDYSVSKKVVDAAGQGPSGYVTAAGDIIIYEVNVTNDGNIDLTNMNVSDPLLILENPVGDDGDSETLNVSENWTFTASYTVTEEDMNSNGDWDGFINNTVSIVCDQLGPKTDKAEVPIEQNPAYTIDKTVIDVNGNSPDTNVTAAGDVINYQVDITNEGNIGLKNVSVNDSLIELTGPFEHYPLPQLTQSTQTVQVSQELGNGILEVGEVWTYVGNYSVLQSDLNNNGDGDGFINNTATVYWDGLDPINDSAAVPVEQNPAYSIDKTVIDVSGNGPEANVTTAGDVVTYQVNVTNDGNIDLNNVIVDDPLFVLEAPIESLNSDGVLEVGEIWTYFGNYNVLQSDLNSNGDEDGFINNTATVDSDELDQENDSAEVFVEQNPAYAIDKIVLDVAENGPEANVTSAGDVISYQIDINNTGNIDLNNVIVDDPLVMLEAPTESLNADGILEVGEIWTYFGNYSVLQSDLNSNGDGDGFINNTATVDCDELDQENYSVAVPVEQNPDYCFYKSVIEVDNGGDCIVDDAGDIIRYRVVVKNDGNVDLTGISVNDTLTSLSEPTGDDADPGILNVGEIWKFYGNYTVTQEDINTNGGGDGVIENIATVSCNELPSQDCSVSQPIAHDAYLRIYKSAIGTDNIGDCIINEAGDIIEYRIAVKNDGKVDLTDVSVNDPMISLEGPVESKVADGVLTVGELWVYAGNYTVTQEDIDSNGGEDGYIDNTAIVSCNELSDETSSIGVPIVFTNNLKEGADSESNNTTVDDETNNTAEDNSNSNDNSSDNDNDDSSSGGSSGSSSHSSSGGSSGTGTARVISNNDETDKVNESSVEENVTETQPESNVEVIPDNTESTEADVEQQTETEGSTSTQKESPGFDMIYGIIGLLGVFLYRRK